MDSREINHRWYYGFNQDTMTLCVIDEESEEDDQLVHIPAKFAVCDTCQGRGRHVNPSIDSRGLTGEDFADDPDFAEDYFNGAYDVVCVECHGERVVPVVDEERATREQIDLADRVARDHFDSQAERWQERERGY